MRLLYRRKYTVPYPRLITNFLKSIIASFALVIFTFSPAFPCLALPLRFPSLCSDFTFSRPLHWLHGFPSFALAPHFPALWTDSTFSRALNWLHVFPRFELAPRFPALCTLSYVFPRFEPALHFSALCTLSYVFPRFEPALRFPRFALLVTFSRLEAEIKLWLGFDWLIAQRKSVGFDSRHVLCTCNAMWYLQLALMNSL